jgi:hypothetical protein
LEDNVDLVVLVKRPKEGLAFWQDKDANAADIVSKARGKIQKASDFLFVVCNQSETDPADLKKALEHSLNKMNEARSQDPYTVLAGDAQDREDVGQRILGPILNHLAESLGRMDQEVLEGCLDSIEGPRNGLIGLLNTLSTSLQGISSSSPSVILDLKAKSETLRRNVTVELQSYLNELEDLVLELHEDGQFLAEVERAHNKIVDEIEEGFNEGLLVWESRLYADFQVKRGWQGVAEDEFNRLRVEISSRYCQIDHYFDLEVDRILNVVGGIIGKHFGGLLETRQGRAALEHLLSLSEEAEIPANVFRTALEDLLGLQISYRSHLHPRVRKELNTLSLTVADPDTGQERNTVHIDGLTRESAQALREALQNFSQAASFSTRKALLNEGRLPLLIFFAAVEQFVDTLIRHGDSENDFLLMASSYRDDIWPNVFEGMKMQSVKMNALKKAIFETRKVLNENSEFTL